MPIGQFGGVGCHLNAGGAAFSLGPLCQCASGNVLTLYVQPNRSNISDSQVVHFLPIEELVWDQGYI